MTPQSKTRPVYSQEDALVSLYKQGMQRAIYQAKLGVEAFGDLPFGCVVLEQDGCVLADSHGTGGRYTPTRHCELLAINEACRARHKLLDDCILVTTLEPCRLCCGACLHAHLGRVVWGAERTDLPNLFRLHQPAAEQLQDSGHPPETVGGVLREECVALFDGMTKW